MKTVIHARLNDEDRRVLEHLKRQTGRSDSELIRRGLRLVQREIEARQSALDRAGASVGRFTGGPEDLSTNARHLEEFGR